ncbi:MAG TPA: DNA repair protein RecN [Anaerolineae bacterium]|nr:DNA repair protein RecN [Anaerolineae bacterium]HQH38955.1 DNA repair protein RecN [Anaerolineae bacterium]
MLRELYIKDFAIIDELHLTLEPGFNVLTGETGAGKSILIDAVALLLGGRADTTAVRQGAEYACVEGLFMLAPLEMQELTAVLKREELEGEPADTLWLSRELRSSGRTVARINGRVVSIALLRDIAERLIDVHGQSEHLSLLRVREHLYLLDRFAGLEALRMQVAGLVQQIHAVRRELHTLRQNERERMQRIDLLRFQVEEINTAKPTPGEKETLEAELVRLSNAEQLTALASSLVAILEEGRGQSPAILDLVGQAQRDMAALSRIDATLVPQAQMLEEVGYQVEDVAHGLRDYLSGIEFNPRRLAWVEERLSLLRQLTRKYGGTVEEVLLYATQAAAELETLEHSDERIAELGAAESAWLEQCAVLCQELSQKRQAAAAQLSAAAEAELQDLRMEGARLGVAFQWRQDVEGVPLTDALPAELAVTSRGTETFADEVVTQAAFDATGIDHVEFLIAPNVGEGLKPMTRIASGGETARLMLALKTVLARADRTPTLIFDEIDQGIGGRVGALVGAKLWQLTTLRGAGADDVHHQVLCITHLPQLAGFGDVHFGVQKQVSHGRTVTQVVRLTDESRVAELSQMLGTQGEAAQQGAREILAQAAAFKQNVATVVNQSMGS